jgi:hypothetical protein
LNRIRNIRTDDTRALERRPYRGRRQTGAASEINDGFENAQISVDATVREPRSAHRRYVLTRIDGPARPQFAEIVFGRVHAVIWRAAFERFVPSTFERLVQRRRQPIDLASVQVLNRRRRDRFDRRKIERTRAPTPNQIIAERKTRRGQCAGTPTTRIIAS